MATISAPAVSGERSRDIARLVDSVAPRVHRNRRAGKGDANDTAPEWAKHERDATGRRSIQAGSIRVKEGTPTPGSESLLRSTIEGLRNGTPNYSFMSPAFAATTRQQLSQLQLRIVQLGAVQSISFKNVEPDGADIYNARFENVLLTGSKPEAYAEGILKVCEQYVRSPLDCVAGVTGANLKTRIEAIMNNRPTLRLNFAKRMGLAIAGILAVAIPLIIGVTNAPSLRAQAQSDLRFEVASVRRVEIPPTDRGVPVTFPTGGIGTSDPRRFTYRGAWLPNLITQAFGVRHDQITGPNWLARERYDIVALIPEGATKEQFNIMLGNLLRDRFHLRFHIESKTMPVYALRVAKDGPKFKETARRADDATAPSRVTGERDAQGFIVLPPDRQGMISIPLPGEIFTTAQDVPMSDLAGSLESRAGRPVVDETGLAGRYDFKIHHEYIRRAGDALVPAPTVFDAVEQQLGLKLESTTKSFPQFIIDSIDREPTDN